MGRKLYFLSETNMDDKILAPRIPDNFFTRNGYEDNTTNRVCFSTSIDGALKALSMNCKDKDFYVHRPMYSTKLEVLQPTTEQVPDCEITGERWIIRPVKLECVGLIRVRDDDGKDGEEFTYGDGKVAKLYGWKWSWVSFRI